MICARQIMGMCQPLLPHYSKVTTRLTISGKCAQTFQVSKFVKATTYHLFSLLYHINNMTGDTMCIYRGWLVVAAYRQMAGSTATRCTASRTSGPTVGQACLRLQDFCLPVFSRKMAPMLVKKKPAVCHSFLTVSCHPTSSVERAFDIYFGWRMERCQDAFYYTQSQSTTFKDTCVGGITSALLGLCTPLCTPRSKMGVPTQKLVALHIKMTS